jgi:hypothetical protein
MVHLLLLTRGDNRSDQLTRRTQFSLMFIALQIDGTSLDNETAFASNGRVADQKVDKTLRESHEGFYHKRVCIAGSGRNHRICARAGSCPCRKRYSRGWKRTSAHGTNSVWRCREWDQWFWPPHGQGQIPIAQKPRRATVKCGPHFVSRTWPRELFPTRKKRAK